MLTFSVATNWDDNLIREIDALDSEHKVKEIFGKLASDFIGGGRPTYALPSVTRARATHHIRLVKATGRKFTYLLNASCLDNMEFTRAGQREIRKLLFWLDSLGVDAITVANPYLGSLIKKEYPRFKLAVSAHAFIDTVRQAKFWVDEIGADRVTLRGGSRIHRNFPLLKKIRAQIDCELQLIANDTCLYDCPFRIYHISFLSHASQSRHPLGGFGIDWSLINCRYKLFTQPEEFIQASWIRPEDVGYYENIGINSLKITDRIRDTQRNIFTLKAYLERKFDGNLVDLLFSINKLPKKQQLSRALRFFLHPFYINIFKLNKFSGLFSDIGIYVDNRKLDGFLDYFLEGKCKIDDCEKCGYCKRIAKETVHIDNGRKEKIEKRLKAVTESLITGEVFSYF